MPKCTRCQKEVAPEAERCPHCGAWLSQLADAPKQNDDSLEGAVRSLLSQGKNIGAIKLYRERTGVGLAAAKDAVERIQRGESLPEEEVVAGDLEKQILDRLAAGQKIAAIKFYREQTNAGLKDAKDAVEALAAEHGITTQRSGCIGVLVVMLAVVVVVGCLCWHLA